MARVFTSKTYAESYSIAERKFLEVAEHQLDDSFYVIHGLPWRSLDNAWQQGESDFVILQRELGLIVVEAKPGTIRHDAAGWKDAAGQTITDPVTQAQQGMHNVQKLLSQRVPGWSDQQVPHTFAVYLCNATGFIGHLPVSLRPEQVIFESDLNDLAATLQTVKNSQIPWNVRLDKDLIQQAVNALKPAVEFQQSICGHLESERRMLIRLTRGQRNVLDLIQNYDRVLIRGCAGSGKTLLAIERAVRFAREGKQVLLLCYNLRLRENLQQQISEQKVSGVDVFAFAELCEHLARTVGIPAQPPTDASLLSDYYNVQCIEYLDQAIRCGVRELYDAAVVDEGQDFEGEWWVLIEYLLRKREASPLYIFYDPDQNIFDRQFQFPISDPPQVLDKNCRNTRRIAEFMAKTLDREEKSMEEVPEGLQVHEYLATSESGVVERANALVQRLVHVEKIKPAQIRVIGSRKLRNSAFVNCANLAGVPLVCESQHDGDPNAIQYATVFRYKGLESDVVILTGFGKQLTRKTKTLFYTAASRAMLRLYVIYSQPATSPAAAQAPSQLATGLQ